MDSGGFHIQLGDLATWVVGIVAAVIAGQQYRQSRFRPAVKAFRDADRRVVVQIINEANGSGLIQDVNLLPPDHPRQPAKIYWWEVDDHVDREQRLVPFVLPGQASAQLVLLALPEMNFDGIRVRVDYGNGTDSGCIAITPTSGHLYGTTSIPGQAPSRFDQPSRRDHSLSRLRRQQRIYLSKSRVSALRGRRGKPGKS